MMTLDARALAVKMLKKAQVEKMHDLETKRFEEYGYFLPYQIAALTGHDNIKKFWGAPEGGVGLERWAARVSEQVRQFLSRAELSPGEAIESLHVFDWTIWNDRAVIFSYETAPAAVPSEEAF